MFFRKSFVLLSFALLFNVEESVTFISQEHGGGKGLIIHIFCTNPRLKVIHSESCTSTELKRFWQ